MADLREIVMRGKKEGRDYRQFRTLVLSLGGVEEVVSVCCFRAHPSLSTVELLAFATQSSTRARGYGRILAAGTL